MTQEMMTKEEKMLSREAIEFCRPTQKEMDSDLVSIGIHRDRVNDLCNTALAYHDQKEINKELYEALDELVKVCLVEQLMPPSITFIKGARAAMAKARGDQS